MKASRAVAAATFVVGATEVPAIMTDQNINNTPPPINPFLLGMTSERQTATRLDKN